MHDDDIKTDLSDVVSDEQRTGSENDENANASATPKAKRRRFHPFDPMRQIDTSDTPPASQPQPTKDDAVEKGAPEVSDVPRDGVTTNGRREQTSERQARVRNRPQRDPATGTQAFYIRKVDQLIGRYCVQYQIPDDVEIPYVCFANWLLAIRNLHEPTSWRVYRNAAVYYLEGLNDPDAAEAAALLRAENGHVAQWDAKARRAGSQTGKREEGDNTARSISYGSYRALLEGVKFAQATRDVRQTLHDFVEASLVTGLWPVEWSAAAVVKTRAPDSEAVQEYLQVVSGGSSPHERVVIRALDISDLAPDRKRSIRRMAEIGAEWAASGVFTDRLKNVKRQFRLVRDRAPGVEMSRYVITPYTFRHQFIANCRQTYKPVEIAALIGHNDVATMADLTAHRGATWSDRERPTLPQPSRQDLLRADDRIDAYRREAMHMRVARGRLVDSEPPVAASVETA